MNCAVIDSDAQVRSAYAEPAVLKTLRGWWGETVFHPDGQISRAAIAKRVFSNPDERKRLEGLIHPLVNQARQREMGILAHDPGTVAFVWDTPLLFEAGLNRECDAIVFINASFDLRLGRVRRTRGWDEAELLRRENLQWPLDRKREISDYVLENTADAGEARSQVWAVLSRILERGSCYRGPA